MCPGSLLSFIQFEVTSSKLTQTTKPFCFGVAAADIAEAITAALELQNVPENKEQERKRNKVPHSWHESFYLCVFRSVLC